MKTINAHNLLELGEIALKHSVKKKKLFGGQKLKLNEDDFWREITSIDWVKTMLDLPSSIDRDREEDYVLVTITEPLDDKIRLAFYGFQQMSEEVAIRIDENEGNSPANKQALLEWIDKEYGTEEVEEGEYVYVGEGGLEDLGIEFISSASEKLRFEEEERKKEETSIKAEEGRKSEEELKERIFKQCGENGEEVWQNYKQQNLCLDMPIELVRMMKGQEDDQKESVSKSSGSKTQLFYGKITGDRGGVSYTLRVDFENGFCSGWNDL